MVQLIFIISVCLLRGIFKHTGNFINTRIAATTKLLRRYGKWQVHLTLAPHHKSNNVNSLPCDTLVFF
jgi:hypothetical protein